MDDTKIAPALTLEEWAALAFQHEIQGEPWNHFGAHLDPGLSVYDVEQVNVPDAERHALAALALAGQPFGFRRDDVTMLRDLAADEARIQATGRGGEPDRDLTALADRIEALLPPAP